MRTYESEHMADKSWLISFSSFHMRINGARAIKVTEGGCGDFPHRFCKLHGTMNRIFSNQCQPYAEAEVGEENRMTGTSTETKD